jgi:ribokinase
MNSPKIVVVGSSNTDMVVKAARIPAPGETVLSREFVMTAGGKGANQAVAAARLGAEVAFVGRVGMDIFGERALSDIAAAGVDVSYVVRDPQAPSGVALIFMDDSGQNSIGVAPGAKGRLTPVGCRRRPGRHRAGRHRGRTIRSSARHGHAGH